MKRDFLKIILLFGVLCALFAFLYQHSSAVSFAEHNRYELGLARLKQLDANVNVDVLKSRFRLLNNYDGFSEQLDESFTTLATLQHFPAFVTDAGRAQLSQACTNFMRSLTQKREMIEQFESQNSIVHNSLNYFPMAGNELIKQAATAPEGRELESDIEVLLRELLMFNLTAEDELDPQIRLSIEKIQHWAGAHSNSADTAQVTSLLAHARNILRRKPKVDTLTREIVALPTTEQVDKLRQLYQSQFGRAFGTAARYQLVLLASCVLLVGGILWVILALRLATHHLEYRVQERTLELSGKNAALQTAMTEQQRAAAELIESKRFLHSTLDALCAKIAILDETGKVIAVNAIWKKFSQESNFYGSDFGIGLNFIQICESAFGDNVSEALKVAAGIRSVLAKECDEFHQEYPCHSPQEQRWFMLRVTRFEEHDPVRLVVAHENITERKLAEAKLAEVHNQLLEVSRQAGMAEVATGVLHNVGNVLNSVNIAANCLAQNLRKSKVVNLPKIVGLLRAHAGNLGGFFADDPKGKQLPDYITQLSDHLLAEQTDAQKELSDLQKHIDHIKDIVAMQQSFAKVSGVTEAVQASELVEDAVRMNVSSLVKHDIHIIKDFAETPAITVEKHKALQILVNLIRNAKQACDEANPAEKRLTLRITNGDGLVRISVSDNGVGIPPENLARIFNHGFTTKKDGHGFGLHSGANAAKEIGGSLQVQSAGTGTGATFTLALPLGAPEPNHSHAPVLAAALN